MNELFQQAVVPALLVASWSFVMCWCALSLMRWWNSPLRGVRKGYCIANVGDQAVAVTINGSAPYTLHPGMMVWSTEIK